jgi:hypothetical protein
MNALTAAHRTLPLGTHPETSASITIPQQGKGPAVGDVFYSIAFATDR